VSRLRGRMLFALIGTVVLITTALSAVGTAATASIRQGVY
jgi:hypothetical protein